MIRTVTAAVAAEAERLCARIKPTRLTPAALHDAAGPDPARPWVPAGLLPLSQSARFAALSPAQRLRYDHLYALLTAEQFAWLELRFLIRPAQHLLDSGVPPEIEPLLRSFVADERGHNGALWLLLQRAAPELYPQPRHALFRPPLHVRALAALAGAWPHAAPAWLLFIAAPEEHTLQTNRAYQAAPECDALFAHLHRLHAIDEARHCTIDQVLCDWLLTPWRARLAGVLLRPLFAAFYDASWGQDGPIDRLVHEFPELAGARDALLHDATAGRGPEFYRHVFSAQQSPLTARLAARHPVLAGAIARIT